ncbi:hypothetical protein BDY21DRAFT_367229 [Lineolata rhizophorae]|uniref:Uncharacterized protein n=1 Tax=Lineolata rhizophorae TaxID=578093 RepID=A0A6A6NND3_9PEZI|nr:hypothetical protein BDY21DRAFT_367229 [Lineolata rhizophorae]
MTRKEGRSGDETRRRFGSPAREGQGREIGGRWESGSVGGSDSFAVASGDNEGRRERRMTTRRAAGACGSPRTSASEAGQRSTGTGSDPIATHPRAAAGRARVADESPGRGGADGPGEAWAGAATARRPDRGQDARGDQVHGKRGARGKGGAAAGRLGAAGSPAWDRCSRNGRRSFFSSASFAFRGCGCGAAVRRREAWFAAFAVAGLAAGAQEETRPARRAIGNNPGQGPRPDAVEKAENLDGLLRGLGQPTPVGMHLAQFFLAGTEAYGASPRAAVARAASTARVSRFSIRFSWIEVAVYGSHWKLAGSRGRPPHCCCSRYACYLTLPGHAPTRGALCLRVCECVPVAE